MRITGERVVSPTGGFNPTWQRHVAAYELAAPLLGPGRVLDLGCGVGHSYHRLSPRETVGLDIDAAALDGQARETVVADMRELPFPDGSFASGLSVHSLEHVPDPERVLSEVARVLESDGTAVFVTPNRLTFGRPDEIIDPYHYVELDENELAALCEPYFESVVVRGLFGSERYLELTAVERRTLDRLLARDPLRLRRLVPRPARQALYDRLLRHNRRQDDPRAAAIESGDFELRDGDLSEALDLVAICHGPRDRRTADCAWCGAPLGGAGERLRGRTRCARCGAATTDPWPSDAELERAYGDWYRPEAGARFALFGDALLRRSRGRLAARIDQIAPPGPVLDVGAGDGTLIDALARRGRSATGLERHSRRPDVHDRAIEDVGGGWAAIVFWHALEHLPDPGRAITTAARLLAPRGVLLIAVPNTDRLQARAFGDRWLALDLPRHLVHLSKRALTERLRAEGLELERVSDLRGGQVLIGWLDGLVGSLPGGLDLYPSLRRSHARHAPLTPAQRAASIGAAFALLPVAVVAAALEVALRRSGSVYVEARHA
jgi:SAM-dependent methyltransferase